MSPRQIVVFALAGALLMTFAVAVVLRTDVLDAWGFPPEPPSPETQVRGRVEALREAFSSTCFVDRRDPLPVWLTFQFDAQGHQTALHVVVGAREDSDEVRACLHRQLGLDARIAPTGEPVTVELPLSLP